MVAQVAISLILLIGAGLLLKSFDRAFWMRHLQDMKEDKYKPLPPAEDDVSEFPSGCPFKDPRETLSIGVF